MMINKILQNFRNELKEEFYKGVEARQHPQAKKSYHEIFRNPNSKELMELASKSSEQIRGVLLKNGNLFVTNGDNMIHDNLLHHIGIKSYGDWRIIVSQYIEKFLCISALKENSKHFYLAESYQDGDVRKNLKEFNAYINIMKKKNPNITLTIKGVWG